MSTIIRPDPRGYSRCGCYGEEPLAMSASKIQKGELALRLAVELAAD